MEWGKKEEQYNDFLTNKFNALHYDRHRRRRRRRHRYYNGTAENENIFRSKNLVFYVEMQ